MHCDPTPELGEGGQQARAETGEEEEELDEETRHFNFWTHQVHIFFTRKFFNAAEHLIAIKKMVEGRRLEEDLRRVSMAPSALSGAPCGDANLVASAGPNTPKVGGADSVASLRVAA